MSPENANSKSQDKKNKTAGCFIISFVAALVIFIIFRWWTAPEQVDLTDFVASIKAGEVEHIKVYEKYIVGRKKNGDKIKSFSLPEVGVYQQLQDAGVSLADTKYSVEVVRKKWYQSVTLWVVILGVVCAILFLSAIGNRQKNQQQNPLEEMRKSLAFKWDESNPISFDDVGGAENAKRELRRLVDFLNNSDRYNSLGAKMPSGLLLEGPPGTGKTLLARALASEANATFLSTTGSEFGELYVGVGAKRVRDLFEQAKENQPAIIYIDELDAVGQRRVGSLNMNEDRQQTLNQLLTELDGFQGREQIVVIASTNRADILDDALLRPGRFDRRVVVDLPDAEQRHAILSVHVREKKLARDVDLKILANNTVRFNGAELGNIVNEAAMLAAEDDNTEISHRYFEEAADREGVIVPKLTDNREMAKAIKKEVIAQNEAIEAVSRAICHHYADIQERANSAGFGGSKPNTLLFGPSGSGKSSIIKSAASILEVPTASISATLMRDSSQLAVACSRLLKNAKNDVRRAENGVICVFGLEDVSSNYAQDELARVIEGTEVDIAEDPYSSNSRRISLDTKNILFLCEYTYRKDAKKRSSKTRGQNEHEERLAMLGVNSRLLHQFPILAEAQPLLEKDLLQILENGNGSPVSQFSRRCAQAGIEVEFDPTALRAIARSALHRGGDARTLSRILDQIFVKHLLKISDTHVVISGTMVDSALPQMKSTSALKANANKLRHIAGLDDGDEQNGNFLDKKVSLEDGVDKTT